MKIALRMAIAAVLSISKLQNATSNSENDGDIYEVNVSTSNDTQFETTSQLQQPRESLSSEEPRNSERPRTTPTLPRPPQMAEFLEMLMVTQDRLKPYLERYHTLMDTYTVLFSIGTGPESITENQDILDEVSRIWQYISHANHALNHIIVDIGQATLQNLSCRPIIIQQSAILQAGIPIQLEAHINLHGRNARSNSNNAVENSNTPIVPTTLEVAANTESGETVVKERPQQQNSSNSNQQQQQRPDQQLQQSQTRFGSMFNLPSNVEVLIKVNLVSSMDLNSSDNQSSSSEINVHNNAGLPVLQLSNTLSNNRIVIVKHMFINTNRIINQMENPSSANPESFGIKRKQSSSPLDSTNPMDTSRSERSQKESASSVFMSQDEAFEIESGLFQSSRAPQPDLCDSKRETRKMKLALRVAIVDVLSISKLQNVTSNSENDGDTYEVNVSTSNDTQSETTSQLQQASESLSSEEPRNSERPRTTPTLPRSPQMTEFLEMLMVTQDRLKPYLERYHTLIDTYTVLSSIGTGPESITKNQDILDEVSRIWQYVSHTNHALKDIIVDIRQATLQNLSCHPIIIQQAGIPIQLEPHISLHGRNAHSNSNNAVENSNTPLVPTTLEVAADTESEETLVKERPQQENSSNSNQQTQQPRSDQQQSSDQQQRPDQQLQQSQTPFEKNINRDTNEMFLWNGASPTDFIWNLMHAVASYIMQNLVDMTSSQSPNAIIVTISQQTIGITINVLRHLIAEKQVGLLGILQRVVIHQAFYGRHVPTIIKMSDSDSEGIMEIKINLLKAELKKKILKKKGNKPRQLTETSSSKEPSPTYREALLNLPTGRKDANMSKEDGELVTQNMKKKEDRSRIKNDASSATFSHLYSKRDELYAETRKLREKLNACSKCQTLLMKKKDCFDEIKLINEKIREKQNRLHRHRRE